MLTSKQKYAVLQDFDTVQIAQIQAKRPNHRPPIIQGIKPTSLKLLKAWAQETHPFESDKEVELDAECQKYLDDSWGTIAHQWLASRENHQRWHRARMLANLRDGNPQIALRLFKAMDLSNPSAPTFLEHYTTYREFLEELAEDQDRHITTLIKNKNEGLDLARQDAALLKNFSRKLAEAKVRDERGKYNQRKTGLGTKRP